MDCFISQNHFDFHIDLVSHLSHGDNTVFITTYQNVGVFCLYESDFRRVDQVTEDSAVCVTVMLFIIADVNTSLIDFKSNAVY